MTDDALKPFCLATASDFTSVRSTTQPTNPPTVDFANNAFDDSHWRSLNLPHDWAVEGAFQQNLPGETGKLPYAGVGWYRKHFTLTDDDCRSQIYLEIDGAMSHSAVWINGQLAGGWPYGYASYRVDLTPFIETGKNVLAIRLNNPDGSSRWYPGGGIYRNVWLTRTPKIHVDHWGTYVTTPGVTPEKAGVLIETKVRNDSKTNANVDVRQQIFLADRDGKAMGDALADGEKVSFAIQPGKASGCAQRTILLKPKLWDLKSPTRYVVRTFVESNGRTLDTYDTPFGVRRITFDKDGFFLNGQQVRLNGVCDHHDLGPLGAALNTRALERQLELLQEMGCNAIRTSHNPPAPELLDLCDRMGFVVMDESFDCWASGKRKEDYHTLFADWHEADQRALIRRDRNHPSVVLWSIGNELKEFRPTIAGGIDIARELSKIVHEEDRTRPSTFGCNVTSAAYNGMQKTVDVFGFNYKPGEYGKFRAANPDNPIFGSETSSTLSTRGEYFFPVSDDKTKGKQDFQVSSYDLTVPPWATTPDAEFAGQEKFPFVAGEFVWTGFDYLGEPTPYNRDPSMLLNLIEPAEIARLKADVDALGKTEQPSRSSYFGIFDLCGFKKDRFFLYQSHWRPDLPMAHILPHWNWPERVGQVTPVFVYTSGDEAELFLNGKTLGRKTKAPLTYRLRWDDVVYEPGELKVVAYRKGQRWAEDVVQTTGAASKIEVTPDHKSISADGSDLSFLTIRLTDDQNRTVPRAKNPLHISITGPGEIVGVDNGDPTNHLSFRTLDHPAFNGLCLVIVRSTHESGTIRVQVVGDGLATGETQIASKRPTP